jgi:hypothetical protein
MASDRRGAQLVPQVADWKGRQPTPFDAELRDRHPRRRPIVGSYDAPHRRGPRGAERPPPPVRMARKSR